MRRHRAAVACLLLALAAPMATRAAGCESGVVYFDANKDGIRDPDEAGISGVRLSDGEAIAETEASGRYQLAPKPGQSLFLIKPADYSSPRADGLPQTWRRAGDAGNCDFGLRPPAYSRPNAPFEVLLIGDSQPKSSVDVGYYDTDILGPLRAGSLRPIANLAISLGDIVNDEPGLYPELKRVEATLGIPWLHAPGNHDVDAGDSDDLASLDSFHDAFGPDTFAWEEALANFVVLDDVVVLPPGGKPYVGGLRETQFAFLESYLSKADPARLLVLALHIPLFDVGDQETFRHADRARLFALLARFPRVLVLSAHTHGQQHFFHGPESGWNGAQPLHEYNVGAACGSFWSGVKDASGVPSATMADGTPNGYARLRIESDGKVSVRWHAARTSGEEQIGLHAPKVLRRGAWPGFGAYANVWMGQADTQVEYRIDAGEWKPMQRVLQADPAVLAENARDDAAGELRGYDRVPEAVASPHLWRGALPTGLAAGKHQVEVRAKLDGFGSASASTSYELREAAP